ncbi:MAG: TPM domain-containing protein [Leptospiraceae bacterium]|nr:TPM domain-containing protein [Leptospiraceae bacterium]
MIFTKRLLKYGTRSLALLLVLISSITIVSGIRARDVPRLSGRVVDETGTLSNPTQAELTRILAEHEDQSSNQIAVLIIDSLEGDALEEFSLRTAAAWGLGQKGTDNGVLLLVAKQDRKMRIEVGYGLEGSLTDARCKQILDNELAPRFRAGDFDAGILAGVQAIIAAIDGSYSPPAETGSQVEWIFRILFAIPFLGIFFFVVGIFTLMCLKENGGMGWFLYFFLIPFWFAFPTGALTWEIGQYFGYTYVVFTALAKLLMLITDTNKKFNDWVDDKIPIFHGMRGGNSSSWSSSSGGSSSSSSFSGGGGSFGGGGSSSSW